MPSLTARRVLAAALMLAPGAALAGQASQNEPPVRPIGPAVRVGDEPFSSLRGLVALGTGQLLVSDTREQKVMLLDPASGRGRQVGRVGRGPGEYSQPGGVYLASGGGGRVYDPSQQRFITIAGDGRVVATTQVPSPSSSFNFSDSGPDQWMPDTVGNFYNASRQMMRSEDDSLSLIRTDAAGRSDTIARLLLQETKFVRAPQGFRWGRIVQFSPADVWAVTPDGWVAVVRAQPYRVEWLPPRGDRVTGRMVAFTPLKVTEEDKQAVRAEEGGSPVGRISVSRSGGGSESKAVSPSEVEFEFKDVKPPFPPHVPRIDGSGRVWVERSRRAGEPARVYDVFDRQGALVARYQLPAGLTLLGFDRRNGVFAVETDADDLLHVVRLELR